MLRPTAGREGARRGRTLVILGSLAAFGPLSMDTYLSALPAIGDDLDASAASVQLTVTACLLGLASGQLVVGPLSDRLGRRRPLLVGLAAYTLASLLCAAAPTVWALIALRLAQGLCGAAGIVIARAIVRDLHEGVAAARAFGLILVVTGLAPILAPVVGAGVLHVTSWRGIFVALAGAGALIGLAAAVALPESLPRARRRSDGLRRTLFVFGGLLRNRWFVGYGLASGFVFGAMFAYIAGSPFVLQDIYGVSPLGFGLLFGLNALGIIIASILSSRLVGRVPPRSLLFVGLVQACAGAALLVLAIVLDLGVVVVCAALFTTVSSVGLVSPNATALALADHPETAGSASALLGLMQFVVGALAAPLVGVAGAEDALPMAITIAFLACAAVVQFVLLTRDRKGVPGHATAESRAARPEPERRSLR
jgi:DHA1 family bicyclomycin/chloramphenicol resistance-like MFS transporter